MSDSLVGRAESLRVFPFSQGEIIQRTIPEDWVAWIVSGAPGLTDLAPLHADEVRETVLRGGYPEPLKRDSQRSIEHWFLSYVERIATHDVAELVTRSEFASHVHTLLRLLASWGQSELVNAKVARSVGVSESAVSRFFIIVNETMR
ncbi:hypothetical protein [Corynebacterium cystitidis]|uniref:hypothetical protein n=1 Tax=Corynebacterium cystitidis TaxID=35757 RepID=UPI001E304EBB|nr:hypothetical protein [Corynebacterium cystitidis]